MPGMLDESLFSYLGTIPRAQWCAADVLLYLNFPISRARSKEVAKAWLRRAIVAAPPRYQVAALASWRPSLAQCEPV